MAAVFKKLKVKKLLLGVALFNATATPALVPGEDYAAAADPQPVVMMRTKGAEITVNAEQLDTDEDDASLGYREKIIAGSHFAMSFEMQLSGSGTAEVPPSYGALLQICAYDMDDSSGTHVDFTKVDDDTWPDATIYFYFEDRLHKALGCQGNVSRTFTNDGFPVFKFDITGKWGGIVTSTFPAPAFGPHAKAVPVSFANTHFKIGATEFVLTNFTCDEKNEVNFSDLPGFEGVSIDDFIPDGEAEIWVPALGAFDPFSISQANDGSLFTQEITHGKTEGNIVICTETDTQLLPPSYGDFEGKRTFKIPFGRKGVGIIRTM
jgi:hypothetical protein